MSRGHGRVQLQVLDVLFRHDKAARLRREPPGYIALADIVGTPASRARTESVRRAVRSLAEEGLILVQPNQQGLMVRLINADDRLAFSDDLDRSIGQ